jgi:hypothetical protein
LETPLVGHPPPYEFKGTIFGAGAALEIKPESQAWQVEGRSRTRFDKWFVWTWYARAWSLWLA